MSKKCYNCNKVVSLDELKRVDKLQEEKMDSAQEFDEFIANKFVHCVGGKEMFHDNGEYQGVVNVCLTCFNGFWDEYMEDSNED